jgi:N-acetylneuraminic acid mutarotase
MQHSTFSLTHLVLPALFSTALTLPVIRSPQGEWITLSTLLQPRQEHTTVALNETTIAVVGGVLGVYNGSAQVGVQTTDSVQLYDIPSDTWSDIAPLPLGLNHPNVAAVDGNVYVLGGLADGGNPDYFIDWVATGDSYVFDPSTDEWTELEPMPEGTERGSAVVGVHDGIIYLAGGMKLLREGEQAGLTTVTAFNTVSGKWQELPEKAANIPDPRQHAGGAVYENTFYVIGGRDIDQYDGKDTVFKLDLDNLALGWSTSEAGMPTARGGVAGDIMGDKFYVFGGEGNRDAPNGLFNQVELFDLRTEKWTELDGMPTPKHGTSAVAVGSSIYIPGGGLQQDGKEYVLESGEVKLADTSKSLDVFTVEDCEEWGSYSWSPVP